MIAKIFWLTLSSFCVSYTQHDSNSAISQYQYAFLAHYTRCQGNYQLAQSYYEKLLSSVVPATAYCGYVEYLLETQRYEEVIALAKKKPELFGSTQQTDSYKMGFMLAQAYDAQGLVDEAYPYFVKLSTAFPAHQEIIYHALRAFMRAGKNAQALETVNRLMRENAEAHNNFIFHFLKYGILVALRDLVGAQESLKKALALHPQFEQGWLFLGILHEQMGHISQAIEGYQRFIDLVGHDLPIEHKLMRLKLARDKIQGTLLTQAQQAYKEKKYTQALEIVETYLERECSQEAYLLKLDILSALGKQQELLALLKEKLTKEPEEDFWLKILYLLSMAHPEQSRQFYELLLTLHTHHPRLQLLALYTLDSALRLKDTKQAFKIGKYILSFIEDPLIRAKVTFQLGVLCYKAKHKNTLKELLEPSLIASTDYLPLLNFAAYYYAKTGSTREKAQKLIERVLTSEPHNPHYRDTQGFIWYKSKDYKKAYELFKELAEQGAHDSTILKHYARVCLALKEYAIAYQTFSKVASLEKRSTKLKKLKRRIAQLQALRSNVVDANDPQTAGLSPGIIQTNG